MTTILYLTQIEFGPGERAILPKALADLGIRRPLVVRPASPTPKVCSARRGTPPAPRFLSAAEPDRGGGEHRSQHLSYEKLQ
jgi:hypothetical protein